MDYLEYSFTESNLDGITIDDFLEKHNKQKNLWWKSLSGISNQLENHLDIFRQNAKAFFNQTSVFKGSTFKTVKTCPAIGDAFLDKLFLVKSPCDIYMTICKDEKYYYQLPDPRWLNFETHSSVQFHTKDNNIFGDYLNIKFKFPIRISTKNNPIMFLEPQYHTPNNPIKVLTGVIDSEYLPGELNINTLIKMNSAEEEFIIKKGTVLCYLWSPEKLELKHNPNLHKKPRTSFFSKYKAK